MIQAQEMNRIIIDKKMSKEVLFGYCDREGLKGEVFGPYYEQEYRTYEPSLDAIKELRKLPDDWTVVIVLGSWCSDSQREVPRFYRIFDEAGFKDSQLSMIAVDRNKEAGTIDLEALDIQLVPTFIFYKRGKEIGRIIETPNQSLENDMLMILARPAKPLAPGNH